MATSFLPGFLDPAIQLDFSNLAIQAQNFTFTHTSVIFDEHTYQSSSNPRKRQKFTAQKFIFTVSGALCHLGSWHKAQPLTLQI